MKKKDIVSRVIGVLTALSIGVLTILPGRGIISDSSVSISGSPVSIYDVLGDSDDSPSPPCPINIHLN